MTLHDLVLGDVDRLEWGLESVSDQIATDGALTIDALLRDATSAPCLLFFAGSSDELPLSARVLGAVEWLERKRPALQSLTEDDAFDPAAGPRVLAVGFDFASGCLARLGDLTVPLDAYRVELLEIDDRRRFAVIPVLGDAVAEETSWAVPCGIRDGSLRLLAARLLDIVRRVDRGVRVTGDRFSRRCTFRGQALVELWSHEHRLFGRVTARGAEPVPIRRRADVDGLADAALRRYLEILASPTDRTRGGQAPSPHALTGSRLAAQPRSIDAIRARVADSEITEEEYDAFRALDPRT